MAERKVTLKDIVEALEEQGHDIEDMADDLTEFKRRVWHTVILLCILILGSVFLLEHNQYGKFLDYITDQIGNYFVNLYLGASSGEKLLFWGGLLGSFFAFIFNRIRSKE